MTLETKRCWIVGAIATAIGLIASGAGFVWSSSADWTSTSAAIESHEERLDELEHDVGLIERVLIKIETDVQWIREKLTDE